MDEEWIDFTELSFLAQRLLLVIERELYINRTTEMRISKQRMAWLAIMSVPNIKIGLRELKEKGYVVAKNKNSSMIKIGEKYAYREGTLNSTPT